MGGAEQTNRYRLPRRYPMPSFGGDPNPFASTVRPGGERVGGHPAPAAEAPVDANTPEIAPAVHPAPKPKRRWLDRLNPFRRRAQAPVNFSATFAPTPPAAPATEQPELSLLAVQVVRNDLSDESEVVPQPRLKGRQLLGRAFPRAMPAPLDRELRTDLPEESLPERTAGAGQVKLF